METFMNRDFLLETETARHLFHDYAESLPLIDYHCHISPKDICENVRFQDLGQVWLGGRNPDGSLYGDHYKWRIMRANGIDEAYITGDKPNRERVQKFAEALELAIGNPMYHWCNLELHKYFGFTGYLNSRNAGEVYDMASQKLREDPKLSVRGLMEQSRVAMVGTTDDPIDDLRWHKKLREDPSFSIQVCPSFRPDKAVNITKDGWKEYMGQLAQSVGKTQLTSCQEVCEALGERLAYFAQLGCRAADHGLDYVPCRVIPMGQADWIFRKAMEGTALTQADAEGYATTLLLYLAGEYRRRHIVMQIHYSCFRNPNTRMFRALGPDTGYDVVAQNTCGNDVIRLLDAMEQQGGCPRIILYSLNPTDNTLLDTVIGAFQGTEVPGKLQHGAAWWFNDCKTGMEEQMTSLANEGLLGNFVGMLTDSRSFLSYARHDYFRRILCNLLGRWVENGEYPRDEEALKKIVQGICYYNAVRYFGLSQ